MSISFVSIQGDDNAGWDVIKKTFPKVSGNSVTLGVTNVSMNQHCSDQKTAEIAAKKMAELTSLPYISNNVSIITVTPFCGGFLAVELKPNGGVTGQGTCSPSLHAAMQEAQAVAKSRNLIIIPPN